MKIDINNYEAFFLDFVEGRLDDASTLEMLAFLRKHPELKAELESFGDMRLEPEELTFKDKNFLKRFDFTAALNQKNFDDFCVAYYEKLLTKTAEEKLFTFLEQYPEKKRDFQLFGKTILKADPTVVFEAKPFLKRKQRRVVRTVFLRLTAVAAGVVLLVSVFYKSPEKESDNILKTPLAGIKENATTTSPELNKVTDEKQVNYLQSRQIVSTEPQKVSPTIEDPIERIENLPLLKPIEPGNIEDIHNTSPTELLATIETIASVETDEDFEVLDYAGKMIREKVLKTEESKPRKKFSLWDLADITLKGYNSISEKDIILHRKVDENGKLTAIAIETETKKYGFETKN